MGGGGASGHDPPWGSGSGWGSGPAPSGYGGAQRSPTTYEAGGGHGGYRAVDGRRESLSPVERVGGRSDTTGIPTAGAGEGRSPYVPAMAEARTSSSSSAGYGQSARMPFALDTGYNSEEDVEDLEELEEIEQEGARGLGGGGGGGGGGYGAQQSNQYLGSSSGPGSMRREGGGVGGAAGEGRSPSMGASNLPYGGTPPAQAWTPTSQLPSWNDSPTPATGRTGSLTPSPYPTSLRRDPTPPRVATPSREPTPRPADPTPASSPFGRNPGGGGMSVGRNSVSPTGRGSGEPGGTRPRVGWGDGGGRGSLSSRGEVREERSRKENKWGELPPAAQDPYETGAVRGRPYNILPLEGQADDSEIMQLPEVMAAVSGIRLPRDIRPPPDFHPTTEGREDIMDWLKGWFGFQEDSTRNQREHLVLLLANLHARQPSSTTRPPTELSPAAVEELFQKVTKNYREWCEFLNKSDNLSMPENVSLFTQRKLLFIGLYLLIWGEAANLRFLPECLCYIFHHMAREVVNLNKHQQPSTHVNAVSVDFRPVSFRDGFLTAVVTPVYKTAWRETECNDKGKAAHGNWRNYDDLNEFFWSDHCFKELGWEPDGMKADADFFVPPEEAKKRTLFRGGKCGFVERRSFWNILHSFSRLWSFLIIMFQVLAIVAFNSADELPWEEVSKSAKTVLSVLSIFITSAVLDLIQAALDILLLFPLLRTSPVSASLRYFAKALMSAVWTLVFIILYVNTWKKRDSFKARAYGEQIQEYMDSGLLPAAGVYLLPTAGAAVFFFLPWIQRQLEMSKYPFFHWLLWWFQSRLYVGRGMRESLWDTLKYGAFWTVLLAAKFAVSYEVQIKPLVAPSVEIVKTRVDYFYNSVLPEKYNPTALISLWAPVVLIYLMDIQLWFAILSAFVGKVSGLLERIGEINSLERLSTSFRDLPGLFTKKCLPRKGTGSRLAGLGLHDMRRRIQRTESFGIERIQKQHVESVKFAQLWNEMIISLRKEDYISDREQHLLQLPDKSWKEAGVRQWPLFFLNNKMYGALVQVKESVEKYRRTDKQIWKTIKHDHYMACAVIEAYASVKEVLYCLIAREQESRKVTAIFEYIDKAKDTGILTNQCNLRVLGKIHEKLLVIVQLLLKPVEKDNSMKITNALQSLYEIVTKEFCKDLGTQFRGHASEDLRLFDDINYPMDPRNPIIPQLPRLHTMLETKDPIVYVPSNNDAQRRILFFCNSIHMDMPEAPEVEKMMSFCVLTPYYEEDVMYTEEKVKEMNADGVSNLYYMQKIYPDEWVNFGERMGAINGKTGDVEKWKKDVEKWKGLSSDEAWAVMKDMKKEYQLREFVSYRAQTLARTVRGMMYYHKALQLQAFLDVATDDEVARGYNQLSRMQLETRDARGHGGNREHETFIENSGEDNADHDEESDHAAGRFTPAKLRAIADIKFTYVVTAQIYGAQKAKAAEQKKNGKPPEPQAGDISDLMKKYHALRIAYVDQDKSNFFSVLVKCNDRGVEEEIYRIRLPGQFRLGEGKPENQNHAVVFTRGEALQAIDMNQDNYLEEAFKMRNLLQEFTKYNGNRKPTILGVREHVFTSSVSSVAWFMSQQETSFVTIGQRVSARPLKVRMHYGHPDVFDRLFHISRGGMSKASKTINLSEDIYAGFNTTLRGGNVAHLEYIQVGKGKDVGLNQIAMFEAKVSSGNGEQILSRDVYRLGHRLDFFRMLSFYSTSVGFFINNLITVWVVYAFLYGRVYMALSGVESSLLKSNAVLERALNVVFIIQVGSFTALPLILEMALERGLLRAIIDFITMQLQFCAVFYTFSLGTKAHYFGRTILHGGAKYRPTGRGFVTVHIPFAENYRLYSRSHFVKGLELISLLIAYAKYGSSSSYGLLTFSTWFMAISFIYAPFFFNPSGMDWLKNVEDYSDFMKWLSRSDGIEKKDARSWETWWQSEQDHLKNTGFFAQLLDIVLDLRYFFIHYGVIYRLDVVSSFANRNILVYFISWLVAIGIGFIIKVYSLNQKKYSVRNHLAYRFIQITMSIILILALVLIVLLTDLTQTDLFVSLLIFLPTGWGLIQIAQVLRPWVEKAGFWPTIKATARLYDGLFGTLIILPLLFVSWLPSLVDLHNRVLFSQAFSKGLQIQKLLIGKRPNAKYLS